MDAARHLGHPAALHDDNDVAESFFDGDFEVDTARHLGHPAALHDDNDVAESFFDGGSGGLPVIFGGRRRLTGGSLQRLVGTGGRRSVLDSCCWYGPVTSRCFAACVRSRPFLFFLYVVLALVLLSSCVSLVLIGSLVAKPYFRASGFINTTCSPSVVSEGSRNGQVAMQTCTCGKGCNSKYRCIRIHVRYTPRLGAETTAVLYDDETALGRQVNIIHNSLCKAPIVSSKNREFFLIHLYLTPPARILTHSLLRLTS